MINTAVAFLPYAAAHLCRFGNREASAVFEVCRLMERQEFDNARPQPRWGVERFAVFLGEIGKPCPSFIAVKLPTMSTTYYTSEVSC